MSILDIRIRQVEEADEIEVKEENLNEVLKYYIHITKDQDSINNELNVVNENLYTFVSNFIDNLNDSDSNEFLIDILVQIIAEIAKSDSGRKKYSNDQIIKFLISYSENVKEHRMSRSFHCCRALGNLCFDNQIARNIISKQNGEESLLKHFSKLLEMNNDLCYTHLKVACGFYLNYVHDFEFLEENISRFIKIFNKIFHQYITKTDLIELLLNVYSYIVDSDTVNKLLSENDNINTLIYVLETSDNVELATLIFEIFSIMSNDVSFVEKSSSIDLCDKLCKIMTLKLVNQEKYNELISDFIVLLLSGDTSMGILYDNGKSNLFQNILQWLESDVIHLQISGALAICNIARTDSYCVQLLNANITPKLLAILQKNSVDSDNSVLLHAIFSCIRNFSIADENKIFLLNSGILPTILTYIDTKSFTVAFKIIGILRFLIDGQEQTAKIVGRNENLICNLKEWSTCTYHEGLKNESLRFVASLIKNCKSSDIINIIVVNNGIEYLNLLLQTQHPIMQNEAIIGLMILLSTNINILSKEQLELIIPSLFLIIQNEPNQTGIIKNIIKLVDLVKGFESFANHEKSSEILKEIELWKTSQSTKELTNEQ